MTIYDENKSVSFEAIFPSEADTFQYSIATMDDGSECVVIEYLDTSLTVQVPESMLTATPEEMTAYAYAMEKAS